MIRRCIGEGSALAASGLHCGLALIAGFDLVVSAAGSAHRAKAPPAGSKRTRFAVLVPARDEEATIDRLLASLGEMTYPRDHFQILVVADHCTDATADVARASGARVFERREGQEGKAAAIGWLLQRLPDAGFDAYAFVDADSVVSTNLLDVMDAWLEDGHDAVQVYDGALNAGDSPLAALAALGMELNNRLRPAGRQVLGLSPGLMGNGMAMTARAVALVDWSHLGTTEDSEAHLALLRSGCRIRFDPRASVLSGMPASWASARAQNARWDTGRLWLALDQLRGALPRGREGLHLRLAIVDQAMPRSVLCGANAMLLVLALVQVSRSRVRFAGAVLALQALTIAPVLMATSPERLLFAARAAPAFVAWKSYLFLRLLWSGAPGVTKR